MNSYYQRFLEIFTNQNGMPWFLFKWIFVILNHGITFLNVIFNLELKPFPLEKEIEIIVEPPEEPVDSVFDQHSRLFMDQEHEAREQAERDEKNEEKRQGKRPLIVVEKKHAPLTPEEIADIDSKRYLRIPEELRREAEIKARTNTDHTPDSI